MLFIGQFPSNRSDHLPYRLRELNSAQSAYQALRINQISNRLDCFATPHLICAPPLPQTSRSKRKKDELNAMVF